MEFQKEDVHGHSVMDMMRSSGKIYTRATLTADIVSEFGPSTTFCTCAAEGMNAHELIDFLEVRGKFVEVDGGFKLATAENCDHH